MTTNYPIFEAVVFPESAELRALLDHFPDAQDALFVSGVPREFMYHRYHADSVLSLIQADRGRVIRFASEGIADAVCVDPGTGEVVYVVNVPGGPTSFVNSSLPQFTRTVKAVTERFPYYRSRAPDEEIDSASQSLQSIIGNIDPAAMIGDSYWRTFIDDVEMGDLSTEDVLAEDEE